MGYFFIPEFPEQTVVIQIVFLGNTAKGSFPGLLIKLFPG